MIGKGFGFGGLVFSLLSKALLDDEPTVIDKLDVILTDVETEGRKQGFVEASREYDMAFEMITLKIKEGKLLLERQIETANTRVEYYLDELKKLERVKDDLEEQVRNKSKQVANKFNIPVRDVYESATAGTLVRQNPNLDINFMSLSLNLIYNHKERKLQEAKQEGYLEAKQLFDKKIENLKRDFQKVNQKQKNNLKKLNNIIINIMNDIIDLQTQIAELTILL